MSRRITLEGDARDAFLAAWADPNVTVSDVCRQHRVGSKVAHRLAHEMGAGSKAYGRPKRDHGSWTEERVEVMTRMWSQGASAGEIAKAIGASSRNSIIGKLHRLKLQGEGRNAPSKPRPPAKQKLSGAQRRRLNGQVKSRVAVIHGALKPSLPKAPFHDVKGRPFEPLPGSSPKPWMERTFGECCWPVGGDGADTLSCCLPCEGSYCAAHLRIRKGAGTPSERDAHRTLEKAA